MKIISKFRDYYDSAMATGQDLTHIYYRAEEAHGKLPNGFEFLRPFNIGDYSRYSDHKRIEWSGNGFGLQIIKVAFGGYVYDGVKVVQTRPVKNIDPPPSPFVGFQPVTRFFYDINELSDFMTKYGQTWFFHDSKWRFSHRESAKKAIGAYLTNSPDKQMYDKFVDKRLPVAVYDPVADLYKSHHADVPSPAFVENARLSDYQFFKKLDAFTAYQELDMFVSGVVAPENKPMVAIDDKHKAYQHGFDCYSFRTGPSKKRAKRCKAP